MADTNYNTSTNVTTGKPKVAGAIYVGATSLTVPTTADGALASGFECVGYISEDGVTISNGRTTENIKAWGGDIVLKPVTEMDITAKFTMIECLNDTVLGLVHGSGNVSGAIATGITAVTDSDELDTMCFVVDTILGTAIRRIVIPKGQITEIEDITYKDSEAVGYGVTVTAFPDSTGAYKYEYTKTATASSAST